MDANAIVTREKTALAAHRAAIQDGDDLPLTSAPRGTFLHGLLLPLSVFAVTLRDPALRGTFLRLAAVRCAILAAVTVLGAVEGKIPEVPANKGVLVTYDRNDDDQPVNVAAPGVQVHLGNPNTPNEVTVLGQKIPIVEKKASRPTAPSTLREEGHDLWARAVAFVAGLTVLEGFIVLFSRRWDDWLSFHISRLARIRPESAEAPERRLSFDFRWLIRKFRKRLAAGIILASGMPLLSLLKLVPVIGSWLFGITVTLWAWYWVGVFTASKSAHAWVDRDIAGPSVLVQSFNSAVSSAWWTWPLRVYGRIWARLVRRMNSAAAAFDRNPASFLGLALARGVLSLPGLYLIARPIIPVAAGRLCAESDPQNRFLEG